MSHGEPPAELRADGITVGYPGPRPPVLVAQSLELRPGRITALIGPNGSGKSTLLKALAGHLSPASGRVLLDGAEIARLGPRAIARRLGILFQEHGAPAGVTVEGLALYGRHPHRRLFEPLTDADHAAVERALALTGAAAVRSRRVDELSGGQRQLAWLALALAQAPDILLLDEPTTFLDLRHQLELMHVIERLRDEGRMTIAMVLHDVNQAARYADDLVALRDGRVVARGPAAEILTPALVRDVFEIDAEIVTASDGTPVCIARGLARHA